ncbi:MAG: PEP-CTERM sorting domain-containing protein [Verrucomicrobiota bacterium]
MPTPHRLGRGLLLDLTLLTLATGQTSHAQNLTGSVTAYEHPAYAGVASHFAISNAQANGAFVFEGDVVIFCSDLPARSLDEDISSYPFALTNANSAISIGSIDDFDIWDRYTTPQDEGLAKAQAHWFIDNYYEDYFINPPASEESARQYAFQNVLWEIMADGGTAAGLDFTTGNTNRSRFSPSGSRSAPELWSHMTTLVNAINASGVDSSYEEQFQIYGALDSRDGYQDYFLLAATTEAMAVPEPSTSMLVLAAGTLLAGRRQRHF